MMDGRSRACGAYRPAHHPLGVALAGGILMSLCSSCVAHAETNSAELMERVARHISCAAMVFAVDLPNLAPENWIAMTESISARHMNDAKTDLSTLQNRFDGCPLNVTKVVNSRSEFTDWTAVQQSFGLSEDFCLGVLFAKAQTNFVNEFDVLKYEDFASAMQARTLEATSRFRDLSCYTGGQ